MNWFYFMLATVLIVWGFGIIIRQAKRDIKALRLKRIRENFNGDSVDIIKEESAWNSFTD